MQRAEAVQTATRPVPESATATHNAEPPLSAADLLTPRYTLPNGLCVICEELQCPPCPGCNHSYCEHGFLDGPYGEYARPDVWKCQHCGRETNLGAAKSLHALGDLAGSLPSNSRSVKSSLRTTQQALSKTT